MKNDWQLESLEKTEFEILAMTGDRTGTVSEEYW